MSEAQPPTGTTGPSDRYGKARRPATGGSGRGRKVAIGVALAAAVGAVGWYTAVQQQASPVEYEDIGFDVVDAEHVDASFQVHMPPGTRAVCTVDALSPSYAQVGTLDVEVGPADTRTSAYEVTVGTSEEATTATVVGCDVVDD
ncbi:DUF4307 domain-containing protein [Isoptericola dokdonensis]|jgi:hypothetical protein|uniref:DUF4307 domain-containing protein n=1 Tax=Isoptericola dokdonensis DS-3 TaxID=1300344 RepID=A0A161IKP5_9MICO|nr:DUF4307 domain-containing protein [Isoptericola dokdonensis]ANC32784.1 hypothetical protein I598_3275 [Isoptericola dokdonensis DS-3]